MVLHHKAILPFYKMAKEAVRIFDGALKDDQTVDFGSWDNVTLGECKRLVRDVESQLVFKEPGESE